MPTFFSVLLLFFTSAVCADISINYPTEFHVQQDPYLRVFHVKDGEKSFGTVVSSEFGRLDFYDGEKELRWINLFDTLLDNSRHWIGSLRWRDEGYWWHEPTHLEIFSSQGLVATLEPDRNEKSFILRDAITRDPLAIAVWSWVPTQTHCLTWFGIDNYVQDWHVIQIDQQGMKEKEIPMIFFTLGSSQTFSKTSS